MYFMFLFLFKKKKKPKKNPSTYNKRWRGCGEKGPPSPGGGNINWCSHNGEQYGGSLKN